MINGTHSLPQPLPPKLEEVKGSPAPALVPSPPKEGGEEMKGEAMKDSVDSIDKTAKMEATEGDPGVGCEDLLTSI